ncbi:acyl carrier protein [Micromonospora echinofusca]|uniref:Acyl carrier protein n=1 Tax=Micromonospora echinofusca TaxID=47858 RepID=A0ABS3VWJ7_MICEH|nr:acyl carrier protein [Micromonospora echinofusca]MBO4208919.1 acyl carrier protein [Micromonospora echinofusca]
MIQQRVRDVFASVFDRAPADLPDRLDPQTVDGWTSLRHLRFVIALENEFGIEIDPDVVPALVSDTAVVDFLTRELDTAGAGRPA